jgi:hypothetical protein
MSPVEQDGQLDIRHNQRMKKRGDQTFLSSLFFPRARLTRQA